MTMAADSRTNQFETPRLVALLDGTAVGNVYQDRNGRFRFVYLEEWRTAQEAYPISLSMPLAASEHQHDVVNAYLWGLLPDNDQTLERYAQRFGVSPRNPVAMLGHMGEDCAGAIQFATLDRVDVLLADAQKPADVAWLDIDAIASELRNLRTIGVPTGRSGAGQFSLAGAQPKIALLFEDGRWGLPNGRTPTNKILKPPLGQFEGFAENEHICLELARSIGLGAVQSRVLRFADEIAIVVDRFDRRRVNGSYHRLHQEDICQALGITPFKKYQSEGGPGIPKIVELLRESSQEPREDLERFISAMAFNWVIAATDGHAKNYALLHGPRGATRLAPFYDILSYLPYAEPELHRVKLALRIGSQYEVRRIGRYNWEDLAKEINLRSPDLLSLVEKVIASVLASLEEVKSKAIAEGLNAQIVGSLMAKIHDRATSCKGMLAAPEVPQ
jgi:serine/threonine-protein kinase HipA